MEAHLVYLTQFVQRTACLRLEVEKISHLDLEEVKSPDVFLQSLHLEVQVIVDSGRRIGPDNCIDY